MKRILKKFVLNSNTLLNRLLKLLLFAYFLRYFCPCLLLADAPATFAATGSLLGMDSFATVY